MTKQLLKDALLWGSGLWLTGYILGILLFIFVPISLVGWIILPIGTSITLWVLWNKIKNNSLYYYLKLSFFWTMIAIIADYFFLVRLFNPPDGYYKDDVYVYYLLIMILPLFVGWQKSKKKAA